MSGFSFSTPSWVDEINETGLTLPDIADRAAFVVEASRRNVEEGTGGPFAAAIFDSASGRLIALGVNLVVVEKCAILHAEIVAIMLAQRVAGTYDFGQQGALELVTSCEPCAMCYGAVPWSGVRRLVCAAREEDARRVGFDEGNKIADWAETLNRRQIEVIRDLSRAEAAAILAQYCERGGEVYNGGR